MILKSFHYRTKQSLVPLYKLMVRPKMEFAVAAWNPWYDKDIACLKKVQRQLIRSLSNVRGTTYEEKLEDAGLTTLEERRKRGDMIETFKTLTGKNNVDKEAWFRIAANDESQPSTRSNMNVAEGDEEKRSSALVRERARTDLRNNSFRLRVGRNWNDLPDRVRNVSSTNSFKNAYDSWFQKTNFMNSSRYASKHGNCQQRYDSTDIWPNIFHPQINSPSWKPSASPGDSKTKLNSLSLSLPPHKHARLHKPDIHTHKITHTYTHTYTHIYTRTQTRTQTSYRDADQLTDEQTLPLTSSYTRKHSRV